MSEDKTLQLPTTDEYPKANQSPPPAGREREIWAWYLVALVFGIIMMAGGGFWAGQRLENQALDETLEAVTESVAQAEQTAAIEVQATGTAVIRSFTATPTLTDAPTLTSTPEQPEGVILPIQVQLRDNPGEDGVVIGTLTQSTIVMVLSATSDNLWLEVSRYAENSEIESGFVPADSVLIRGGALTNFAVAYYPSETPTNTPFPTPVPSQTALPTPTPVIPIAQVSGVSIPIYDMPASDGALVSVLLETTQVEIIGVSQDNNWYEISYVDTDEESQIGFVAQNNLNIIGGSLQSVAIAALPTPTAIPPTETLIPTPESPQAVSQGMLLLIRSGPADIFEPVGFVDNEAILTINAISPDGQWLQVDFPSSPTGLGWISTRHIDIAGTLQYLPIVQGAIPPTPEIEVVLDGNIARSPVAGNPSPTNSQNPLEIAELPRNFRVEFFDVPNVEIYSLDVGLTITGENTNEPYSASIEMGISEDKNKDKFIFRINVRGDDLGDLEDIRELVPFSVGGFADSVYVYFEEDDFCFPSDEKVNINEAFEGFDSLTVSSKSLITDVAELGVFGRIDESDFFGLSAVHYRFLGYNDNASTSGYAPTEDVKVDLWFDTNQEILIAFSINFNFNENDMLTETIGDQIDFYGLDIDEFVGQVRFFALPKGFGEGASIYSDPPSACDLLAEE